MARQKALYPKTVGVRLSVADQENLARLCTATRRPPCEVIRLLVRQAQTADVPTFTFPPAGDERPNDNASRASVAL